MRKFLVRAGRSSFGDSTEKMLFLGLVAASASALQARPAIRCPSPVATATATAALPTAEAAKLFGRFAEPVLYLDAAVGACCHSACSDCEWRDPGGGYRFDLLKSTVAKWLPCYTRRDFADERGCHTPRWAETLLAGSERVTRDEFAERLLSLEYTAAMGPKGKVQADDSEPMDSTVDALWRFLSGPAVWEAGEGAAAPTELDSADVLRRLQDMSADASGDGAIGEGPDSVVWKEFAAALGAAPFEYF